MKCGQTSSVDRNDFARAEGKYSEALKLSENHETKAKLYMDRGAARYLQGKTLEGKNDIRLSKSLCSNKGEVRMAKKSCLVFVTCM